MDDALNSDLIGGQYDQATVRQSEGKATQQMIYSLVDDKQM